MKLSKPHKRLSPSFGRARYVYVADDSVSYGEFYTFRINDEKASKSALAEFKAFDYEPDEVILRLTNSLYPTPRIESIWTLCWFSSSFLRSELT